MINISESIAIAFQSYQTGQLFHAELICRQIIQQQANCFEALHLLGVIAHQMGNLKEAIFYYQQMVAIKPDHAEAYYSLGVITSQSGQIERSIAYYQQAIAFKPDYTDAHFNLGYALQQQGNRSAAVQHYQQAIALNPDDAEAHGNLAYTLLQQGQIEAAIAHYQQVITLKPDVPEIYHSLGDIFRQQNQMEAATTYYRWALTLNPSYVDAHLKLGATLHMQGQLQEASFYYQQAIFLEPNLTDAHYNLGKAFLEQGKYEEAISQYQQALSLEPDFLDAYLGLGCALIHQVKFEEATACFQQALILNPDHTEVYQNLGIALANQNKLDEAIGCFQKVLQLKPDLIEAYWQSQFILPILYDNQEQIFSWRQRFCRALNDLIKQTITIPDSDSSENTTAIDEIPHLKTPGVFDLNKNISNSQSRQALNLLEKIAIPFYLGYQGINDRGLQRKYGNFIHRVMAANYPRWVKPQSLPTVSKSEKIRVGYVSVNLKNHNGAKWALGWIKNHNRQDFEIYSYYMGNQADQITQQFQLYSDFHHLPKGLEAVCKQIVADKLHILIFTDIGIHPQTTLMAGLRLATVQCTAWGHPITSGLPTIDYYLSGEMMEPENGQSHYSERLVRLPNIGICYEKPPIPEPTKNRSDFQLREDAIVYLSCQSLYKYLPQFDHIFARIAQRVPESQFVFIGNRITGITAQFQARVRRVFANLDLNSEDYCVFLPYQDHVSYVNLNLVSDIFLDTFSWSGGNTTMEAIACGLPIVTCPGEFMRGRHSYGILKMMGVTETIAQDEAEYVEIAVKLGLAPDWRQALVRKIYERHGWLYEDKTCVTALESFYKRVVQ